MYISSTQNPEIKNIVKLSQKSGERKNQKRFVVEGMQENQYALANGFKAEKFYVSENIGNNDFTLPKDVEVVLVSDAVYQKIAYRQKTEGLIGVYHYEESLVELENSQLILVLEGIEKPGNLGAILRSALAFGVDGIILTEKSVDQFNPNVIRSSVGTVFTIPIQSMSNAKAFEDLKKNQFEILGTDMHLPFTNIQEVQFSAKTVLLFGTEHSGLSHFWQDKMDTNFLIPTENNIDSLNLSNAVAISLFQHSTQS